MTNLVKRSLTGAAFVIVLAGSTLLHPFALAAVLSFVVILGMREYFDLVENEPCRPLRGVAMFSGAVLLLVMAMQFSSAYAADLSLAWVILLIVYLPLLTAMELFRKSPQPFSNIAHATAGLLFVALPVSLLLLIAHNAGYSEYRPEMLLGYFLIVWTYDTFAYVTGRLLGRHKMTVRLSPKKTWEGAAGGLICSLGLTWFLSGVVDSPLPQMQWMILAAIVVVTGTLGDLSVSMLKRSAGKKDTGTLLPGHGGVLDRFDSVLLSSPFAVVYLAYFT